MPRASIKSCTSRATVSTIASTPCADCISLHITPSISYRLQSAYVTYTLNPVNLSMPLLRQSITYREQLLDSVSHSVEYYIL